MRVYNIRELKDRRKELRNNPTAAEVILWTKLRSEQLGYKFRRQHSIGGYILDFYCPKKKLIIELDGPIHEFHKEDDLVRDKFFTDLGCKVRRFKNSQIETELEGVVSEIHKELL